MADILLWLLFVIFKKVENVNMIIVIFQKECSYLSYLSCKVSMFFLSRIYRVGHLILKCQSLPLESQKYLISLFFVNR